jgi:hypothetical protein
MESTQTKQEGCFICNDNTINALCPQCKNGLCQICFTKVNCCPFCKKDSFGLLNCELPVNGDEDEEEEEEDETEIEYAEIIRESNERETKLLDTIKREQNIRLEQEKRLYLQQTIQEMLIKNLLDSRNIIN